MFTLILGFITRFLPLIRVISVLAAFFGYTFFIYHKTQQLAAYQQQKLELNQAKIHNKIEQKNMLSKDADLDKRLEKWMRD